MKVDIGFYVEILFMAPTNGLPEDPYPLGFHIHVHPLSRGWWGLPQHAPEIDPLGVSQAAPDPCTPFPCLSKSTREL